MLRHTTADYVVIMNSDTVVTHRWLHKLHDTLAVGDRVAAVGPISNAASWQSVPITKNADGSWATNPLPDGVTPDIMANLVERCSEHALPLFPLLNGFCTLFRKEALERLEYFDELSFPQGYGEENDLCLRMASAGYELRVADHCYVYHAKSRSFGSERRATLSKESNEVLRRKHGSVDFRKLEEEMASCRELQVLRSRLSSLLLVASASGKAFEMAAVSEGRTNREREGLGRTEGFDTMKDCLHSPALTISFP